MGIAFQESTDHCRCVDDVSVVVVLQSLNRLLNQIIDSLKSLQATMIMVVIFLDFGVI